MPFPLAFFPRRSFAPAAVLILVTGAATVLAAPAPAGNGTPHHPPAVLAVKR